MITGETEQLIQWGLSNDNYDNLFGKRDPYKKYKRGQKKLNRQNKREQRRTDRRERKSQLTLEEVEAQRARKENFFNDLKMGLSENGGITGIFNMFKKQEGEAAPEDFTHSFGTTTKDNDNANTKQEVPTGLVVVGVLFGAGLLYMAFKPEPKADLTPSAA